jgi:hypothetical protein
LKNISFCLFSQHNLILHVIKGETSARSKITKPPLTTRPMIKPVEYIGKIWSHDESELGAVEFYQKEWIDVDYQKGVNITFKSFFRHDTSMFHQWISGGSIVTLAIVSSGHIYADSITWICFRVFTLVNVWARYLKI